MRVTKYRAGIPIEVPALTVRRASSTIELRDGQSFVLAGLLNNDLTTAQQQLFYTSLYHALLHPNVVSDVNELGLLVVPCR